MLRRCLGLAIATLFTLALAPAWGQNPSKYDKETVKALSKKIDNHLAKVWKTAKVSPALKAEDHVFFRRLNLDLVGRIPDVVHVQDFLDDDRADKRWKWVDKLLDGTPVNLSDTQHPPEEHAHHFANVWRNIILGAQTNQNAQFLMPQFEAWLRDRVAQNTTLDEMVKQILTNSSNPGMNFNPGQMQNASPQLFFIAAENKAENLAGATSRVFMGVKIECAQCHAHPFATWKQEQFWEFAAFYSGQQQNFRPGGKVQGVQKFVGGREIRIPGTGKVVKAKFLNGKEPDWENAKGGARQVLADWVTKKDNPYFARAMADHIWSYLMGVSLLEPIMEPSEDNLMTHPDLLDDLAKGLIDNNFDAKFLIRAIVHSDAYQRASGGAKLADKEDYQLFVRMPIRALSPEQIYDSVWMATSCGEKQKEPPFNPNQFFNQLQSPRAQFLAKFANQDRRHEPQTSILQALFMMNGKVMADKTKVANNADLHALANPKIQGGNQGRLVSLYRMVLSRPPRQDEIDRLVPYLERGGATGNLGDALSDVYWALLNSSEFLLNH